MTLTIRERLEAIRDENDIRYHKPSNPASYQHAVAALQALDAAERGSKTTIMRNFALVHDPESS